MLLSEISLCEIGMNRTTLAPLLNWNHLVDVCGIESKLLF